MRKLASIRMIGSINPIQNADNIECATIDGWKVVVKKGQFVPGDLCVYFEIDSVLPVHDRYEFLRKTCWIKTENFEGFRLKTIKMRGQISQGLAIPFSEFPEIQDQEIHSDVTEILNVVKWEPAISFISSDICGIFPSFIPKTDQERIQNLDQEIIQNFSNHVWEVTEKLEGQSMTVYHLNGKVGVCSRNYELRDTEFSVHWNWVHWNGLDLKIKKLGRNLAIQGEFIGPKVQGNHYGLEKHDFRVFDIIDIDLGQKIPSHERYRLCEEMELSGVPVVFYKSSCESFNLDDLINRADGPTLLVEKNVLREGLVYKSINNPEISFKVVSNQYLLGEK